MAASAGFIAPVPQPNIPTGTLSVLALFKNEGDILWEWCRHYLEQGADQIVLINNNSTDDWRGSLSTLALDPRLLCLHDPRRHAQERIYNDVRRSGLISSEWLLVCDLDEFVYARPPFQSIAQFLSSLEENVSSVVIPWKNFGSSGHQQHPDGRVIDNFQWRQSGSHQVLTKTISRVRRLNHLWVHHSRINGGISIRPDGTPLGEQNGWISSSEASLQRESLHLNHYAVRSRQFYTLVKARRGNAYTPEHLRDDTYFQRFDHNDQLDDELARLSHHWAPQPPQLSWFSPERPALPAGPRPPLFRLLPTAAALHESRRSPARAGALERWRPWLRQIQRISAGPKACQAPVLVALAPNRNRSARRRNQALKHAARALGLPVIRFWQASTQEQRQALQRSHWLVSPMQPGLEQVHQLSRRGQPHATLVLVCSAREGQRNEAPLELEHPRPHRLLLLNEGGQSNRDQRLQQCREALTWLQNEATRQAMP